MIKALDRVSPESVGISSAKIQKYIEQLEASGTEMHGIMIARHGKVCAEAWWAPYSAEIPHGCQSLTKTYTTTAIGVLMDEGKLHLEDNVAEILKDDYPEDAQPFAKKLTVRNVLTMYSGVKEITFATSPTWIADFFRAIKVEPGTMYCYSGMCTAILGAIVNRITGMGIKQYMTDSVFNRIGIDTDSLKWIEHRSGLEYCGGGLHSTTEDNLRLGLLYLGKGMFDGQRVVSKEWVEEATKKQVDNPDMHGQVGTNDENSGYGYQVWCAKDTGKYYFVGSGGQYIICDPKKDVCISINQLVPGAEGLGDHALGMKILSMSYELAEKFNDNVLEDDVAAEGALRSYLLKRSLDRRPSAPVPSESREFSGKRYKISKNCLSIIPSILGDERKYGVCVSYKLPKYVSEVQFDMQQSYMTVNAVAGGKQFSFDASFDGLGRVSELDLPHDLPNKLISYAVWTSQTICKIYIRYIETNYETVWTMNFGDNPSLTFKETSLFAPGGIIVEEYAAERV